MLADDFLDQDDALPSADDFLGEMPQPKMGGPDRLLNPEFVRQLREDFDSLPPEKQLPTLRAMAKDSDVYGRAAREILRTEDVQRARASEQRALNPAKTAALMGARQPGAAGAGAGASAGSPMPEFGTIEQMLDGEDNQTYQRRQQAGNVLERDRMQAPIDTAIDAKRREDVRQRSFSEADGQTLKDLEASGYNAAKLANDAAAFFGSAGYKHAMAALDQFDRIDAGQPTTLNQSPGSAINVSLANNWARAYEGASPEARQKLRQSIADQMQQIEGFVAARALASKELSDASAKLTGGTPKVEDVRSLGELTTFLKRSALTNAATTVATVIPGMAAARVLGSAAGAGTSLAGITGMALGDSTGDAIEYANKSFDPQRFANPDRQQTAAADQARLTAQHVSDSTGATLAGLPLYVAADLADPSMILAKQMAQPAARTIRHSLKHSAKDLATSIVPESFGEGFQKVITIGEQMARGERPIDWTGEDSSAVLNEAAGAIGITAGSHAVGATAGAARVKLDDFTLARAAERGDVAAAVELADRRGELSRPAARAVDNPVDNRGAAPGAQAQDGAPAEGAGGFRPTPAPTAAPPAAPEAPAQPTILDRMGVTRVQGSQAQDDDFSSLNDEIAAQERAAGITDQGEPDAGQADQPAAVAERGRASASADQPAGMGGVRSDAVESQRDGGGAIVNEPADGAAAPARVEPQGRADAVADTWSGAKGRGFATEAEAMLALPRRQREKPELDWSPEPIGDTGRWQLVGRSRSEQTAPVPEREAGGAGRVDRRSDDEIRAGLARANDAQRARSEKSARRLREQAAAERERAAALRKAGTPELIGQAEQIEEAAGVLERGAQTVERGASMLPILQAPPAKHAASFAPLQAAMRDTFGRRVVPYLDARPNAVDGFAQDGVAFVNLANPERSAAFTVFHEVQHVVRQESLAGNKQARAATALLDQVWDMIPQKAKRQYAHEYLFRHAIKSGELSIEQALEHPKLRDEMLSDFMGKRADDEEFWSGLASKHPQQFGSFVSRWLDALNRVIAALKGKVRAGGNKDIDVAIAGQLEHAKAVAEKVLKAWADMNPELARQQGAAQQESVRHSQREGSAGVLLEVAPNPDQPVNARWKALPKDDQEAVTKDVFGRATELLEPILGKLTFEYSQGMFEGSVNPNVVVHLPGSASFEQHVEAARILGYALDQKAMVVFDENDTTNGAQAGFVKVIPPSGASTAQVESLLRAIVAAVPQADGGTVRDGAIVFGNFSEWSGAPLSDAAFGDAIAAAVQALPSEFDGTDVRDMGRSRSEYIQPETRDGYLEGTRYGGGDSQQEAAGRDAVRGRDGRHADPEEIRHIGRLLIFRRDKRIGEAEQRLRPARADRVPADGAAPDGLEPGADRGGDSGGIGGARSTKQYGTPIDGSVSVDAWHFSTQDRPVLSSAAYGSGLKGSGAQVFKQAKDGRLGQRIYFYVNRGNGITPEAGVGGRLHRVELRNVYDADADPLNLRRGGPMTLSAQSALLDRGFDGYLVRGHNNAGMAVLLGPRTVEVEALGPSAGGSFGRRAPSFNGDIWYSKREDEDEGLGAFNIDRMMDDGDAEVVVMDDHISEEEMADLNAEVAEAFYRPRTAEPEVVKMAYETPDDRTLAAVGIMAEDAYKPLDYGSADRTSLRFVAPWAEGSPGRYEYEFAIEPNGDTFNALPAPLMGLGAGRALGLRRVSRQAAEDYNRRVAASVDLTKRGFDLFTAVPPASRKRVLSAWKKVAELPGAFTYKNVDPMAYKGAPPVQLMQTVADQMLDGSGWRLTFSQHGPGWYHIEVKNLKDESVQTAQLQYVAGADRRLVFHTERLSAGSGAGKPVYQVGFAAAHALGLNINADPQGLTGVNTYRRTEQMMAAAVRSGGASAANPGVGQRIYGWNARAKDAGQHDRNLVRLALASARNAVEAVPRARDLSYSIETDSFTWRRGPNKGESAEAFVKDALARSSLDVRALGTSRSTLARAAITLQAIDNELNLKGVERVASPILYSSREDVADAGDSRSRYDGITVRQQIRIADTGEVATLTMDAGKTLRSLDDRAETFRRMIACLSR